MLKSVFHIFVAIALSVASISQLHAGKIDSYNNIKREFYPLLTRLHSLCNKSNNNYQNMVTCTQTLQQLNTQKPLAVYTARNNHATALGIEYKIGRAAPIRIYQVYEYDESIRPEENRYLSRKPINNYLSVQFYSHDENRWVYLSYYYQGRYLFASRDYLNFIKQQQQQTNLAHSELTRLGPDKDLDYHLKWSDGPALGLNFERLDWMGMLLNRLKPKPQQPKL